MRSVYSQFCILVKQGKGIKRNNSDASQALPSGQVPIQCGFCKHGKKYEKHCGRLLMNPLKTIVAHKKCMVSGKK